MIQPVARPARLAACALVAVIGLSLPALAQDYPTDLPPEAPPAEPYDVPAEEYEAVPEDEAPVEGDPGEAPPESPAEEAPQDPPPAAVETVNLLGITLPARDPVVAAVASGLLTGAGQAYNGDWIKGGLFFASNLLYAGGFVADLYTGMTAFRWGALGLMLAAKGWSVWDAYQANLPAPQALMPPRTREEPLLAWRWTF